MFHVLCPSKKCGETVFLALTVVAVSLVGLKDTHAQTISGIVVPGSANPFLAGMPAGSTASGDSAPAQSPTQLVGLTLTSGGYLTFGVAGSVDYGGSSPTDPPDGQPSSASFYATAHGAENGMGGYTAPANALVGVFLTNSQPDTTAAPSDLDFTSGSPTALGLGFSVLSPQLKQVFFIGDGLTGDRTGSVQRFNIPTGATRFYLGTVDGSGWFNNSGQFTVSATRVGSGAAAPEPGSLVLLASAGVLPLMGAVRRRRA